NTDSLSVAVSSEIYEQEVNCVKISKRVWQSNELDKYMPQDPQDNYQGYESDEYGSEFNLEEVTVPTSSNYYSESLIIRHGHGNVEIANKKPCDTKIKTGDSTTALWRHLKIAHGYSKTTMQQSKDNTLVQAQNDIVTHWNSTYNAWQEKDAIANGKRLKAIMITEDEWTTVANIINILKPFNDITNYISGSSYPTMSIIYPMISTL
ncbi:21477_t:CDS:2, partial [Gigaspora margarita]